MSSSICIPMISGQGTVEFYPDELPADHNDLIDVLRAELAPFKVWRSCAIEYHRQGFHQEFDAVLTEIVNALEDTTVDKIYRERDDYAEGITEIYVALASKALGELARLKSHGSYASPEQINEHALKVVQQLASADEKLRINEYTWLIKGFYEIVHGEIRRAEDHFRAVHDRATKVQSQQKKKYLYGSLLGLGVVSYARQKYQIALDHFTKAVTCNPACGGTVRLAVACCCFKLEQYERARMAADRALVLEPASANILVLQALLEQASVSQRDRAAGRHQEQRSSAFELCQMALAMDPSNAAALNMLAGHYFSSRRVVVFTAGCFALDDTHILALREAVAGIRAGDQLSVGADAAAEALPITAVQADGSIAGSARAQSLIESVNGASLGDSVLLTLGRPLPNSVTRNAPVSTVRFRELSRVLELASQALQLSVVPAQRAESHYLMGKVAHCRGALDEAFDCYRRALKESPELSLAAFGAAQILLSRSELGAALELFEKVQAKSPDDKDTQAYVMLLNAAHKGAVAPFEKLREVAPGFVLEADLWLLQGQLRQKRTTDHAQALKCYMHAKDCIEQVEGAAVPPAVLSNIAVLQHSVGRLDKAIECCEQALASFRVTNTHSEAPSLGGASIYRNADFEGIFYCWRTEPLCAVRLRGFEDPADGGPACHRFEAHGSSANLAEWLSAGDEVVVRDVRFAVKEVSAGALLAYSPVRLSAASDGSGDHGWPLFVKQSFGNFSDETLTYCYNLARLMEEAGRTRAASEIYVELLKRHPSFIECYLRLSVISCDIGKFSDASEWLTRALEVNEEQPDATICLGDLYYRNRHAADAKRCYDKICAKNRHDARSMLSLGNFYFSGTGKDGSASSGAQLKESYKFFFHVLNEDAANIYAANGLGMVCAEKGEVDAAREIFSKAREACSAGAASGSSKQATLSGDISTNLAHVYLAQNRIADAERLYQATCRSLSRSSSNGESAADRSVFLTECVAYSQFRHGRHEDALRTMQRAVHTNPADLRLWSNAAIVAQASASAVISKSGARSVGDICDALEDMALAARVFAHLSAQGHSLKQSTGLSAAAAATHLQRCEEKESALRALLVVAREEEERRLEERSQLELEHASRLRVKQEERERAAQAVETERRERQQLVAQKEQRLQELHEKWVLPVASSAAGGPKAARQSSAGGKRRKKGKSATASGDSGSEDGDRDMLEGGEDGGLMFDGEVDRSKYEGEIDFGSSSEDEESEVRRVTRNADSGGRTAQSQLESDLFGDDDEEDGEDGALNIPVVVPAPGEGAAKRKAAEVEASSGAGEKQFKRLKKRAVLSDDDDEMVGDELETEAAPPADALPGVDTEENSV